MFRQISFGFLLILLASFLVLPNIVLAEDFEDINPEKIEKYLELSAKDSQNLLFTLKQVFTTDWIYRESSIYSTDEERLVPLVLRKAVAIQALNHLLTDAPVEITLGIIKNAAKIARLFLTQDIKAILEELEKQTVQKAINYGINALLENEIRVTPGAIEFIYTSQKGEQRKVIFQYVLIYQPIDKQRGKVAIRFYSPDPIEPPRSKQSIGGSTGIISDLQRNLPPFTVEITGRVEKDELNSYWWVDEKGRRLTEGPNSTLIQPLVKIDFSQPVPDLGIRPLGFWARNVLKPIITTIKEVEIIITKVTGGGSAKIGENLSKISEFAVNVWNTVKSAVSKLNPFGAGVGQNLSSFMSENEEIEESEEIEGFSEDVGVRLQQTVGGTTKPLDEAQNNLDDIAERIDILDAEMTKLAKEKGAKLLVLENEEGGQEDEITEEKIEEEETIEEEKEEIEDLEEEEKAEEKEAESQDICSVDVNTASKEDLEKITGVGPIIAQRIIETRPFYSLNDLTRVSGIGEITLQKIIVQGCAYVSGYVGGGSSGGASAPPPSSPPSQPSPPTYPQILISEIQISPLEERFVELYNPNNENINLTDWYIQRKTETGDSWNSFISSTYFAGKIIISRSHFLIASSSEADIISGLTLTESNSLVLKNPNREITDLVGWGNAQDFETATATSPESGKSIGRKWATTTESYSETDNNQTDFELQTPTPKAQNQSPEPEPEPPPPSEEPLLTIAINEIAWMGTKAESSDEWLELYNNSSSTIDLNNWTLTWSHGTSTNTVIFSGETATTTNISGYDFYLIERTNDNTISDISADLIYTGGMVNDGEKLELRDSDNNLIDLVDCSSGWFAGTSSPDYISMERINPNATGTLAENWANNNLIAKNGLDAEGNLINGTPKAQNSVYQSSPPEPVSDLTLDSQNSSYNNAALTWSTSTDPDTLSENLTYKIYYSREGEITEDNLNATSTFSATTSAATITISDLYYNSTYYFGLKVFDGQNYSVLSNIVFYQTARIYTIDSGNLDFGTKNSARKIARASNGDFYVVYVKDQKVFLAKSEDNGENWQKESAIPESSFEQKNPSIAIDSNDNLHLVWQEKDEAGLYQIRYRKYDNSWQAIETLTSEQEWNQEMPAITIDSQDNVHIAWFNNRQRVCSGQGDCYPAPQILYRAFVNNQWQAIEIVRSSVETDIHSLTLSADASGNIHLVWQATLRSGPSWYTAILYKKRTDNWGEIKEIDIDTLQGEQVSIVVDLNNSLHIVWQSIGSYCDPDRAYRASYIKYVKYDIGADSWGEVEKIAENCRYSVNSPSIAVNSDNYLYAIWRDASMSGDDEIHQKRYSGNWESVKVLLETNRQNYLKQPNLLWGFYPIIAGKRTNRPTAGSAFIYYDDELKFYQSQDLTFE